MLRVGDRVRCQYPGSWVDGKTGTILALDVMSSDGIHGHQVQMEGYQTIVEPENLELV